MAISKKKMDKMKNYIYDLMDTLDPTGTNTQYYKEMFDKMTLQQFEKYFKEFLYNDKKNLKLRIQPNKNDNGLLTNIRKAAKKINVPLFEYVYLPFASDNGEVYKTKYPVLVGYVHIKRLQQMVSKKNSMSTSIDKRSAITGQVDSDDKNSRVSDMENIGLTTLESPELIKEFLAAKADDLYLKSEMNKQIKNDGYVDLSKIHTSPKNKVALNTLDVYFTCAGIKTDLISDGLLLKRTMDVKSNDVQSMSSQFNKE